jgi:hypothetical protein
VISLAALVACLVGAFALLFGARDPRIEALGIGAGVALFAITFHVSGLIGSAPNGIAIWREVSLGMLMLGLLFAVVLALAIGPARRPTVLAAHRVAYGLSITFWTAAALILVSMAASL